MVPYRQIKISEIISFYFLKHAITLNDAECWQVMASFGMEIKDQCFTLFTVPKENFLGIFSLAMSSKDMHLLQGVP